MEKVEFLGKVPFDNKSKSGRYSTKLARIGEFYDEFMQLRDLNVHGHFP